MSASTDVPRIPRRYGQWSGNPEGQAENVTRCIAAVPSDIARGMVTQQCSRPRGKGSDGLYCGVHARSKGRR